MSSTMEATTRNPAVTAHFSSFLLDPGSAIGVSVDERDAAVNVDRNLAQKNITKYLAIPKAKNQ